MALILLVLALVPQTAAKVVLMEQLLILQVKVAMAVALVVEEHGRTAVAVVTAVAAAQVVTAVKVATLALTEAAAATVQVAGAVHLFLAVAVLVYWEKAQAAVGIFLAAAVALVDKLVTITHQVGLPHRR
tara:strand:+ start:620 stop:1009 length:390 start_codon:yes stop_codon:yes gene_type:complete